MNALIEQISAELEASSDEKTRQSSQRFFKEEIRLHGAGSRSVTMICRNYLKLVKSLTKDEIFNLCEELFKTGYFEESIIACNWAESQSKLFKPSDFKTFERWINTYITNWATCDTFCNHTMGAFIEKYPTYLHNLKRMTKSPNRWVRRAAAVSLIVPARKGLFLADILNIAELLITDPDDMVQKGYGWMLKVAADKHQQVILNFVIARKAIMPRTALRYAIEKMPKELKELAMEKKIPQKSEFEVQIQLQRMTNDEFRKLEISYSFFQTPFGKMLVASTTGGICYLSFGEDEIEGLQQRYPFARLEPKVIDLHHDVKNAVDNWGSTNKSNTLPLHLYGTDFQIKIWKQLLNIPFGQQTSYQSIATKAGRPKAVRATGTAIGNNPVAILIPCHRVITSAGKIGGYRWGLDFKRELLTFEKMIIQSK